MKGFGDQNKLNKKQEKISKAIKPSKEQIYNQAIHFHSKYYRIENIINISSIKVRRLWCIF